MKTFIQWLEMAMFGNDDEEEYNGSEHGDDTGWTDEETEDGDQFWGSAGAGVLPICTSTGNILVQFRSGSVDQGHTWGTIGGALRGEHLRMMQKGNEAGAFQAAAMEEFQEEIGSARVGKVQLVPAYQFKKGTFKYQNFLGLIGEEFQPKRTWEADGYEWVSFDELIELEPKHFGLKALIDNSGQQIRQVCERGKRKRA